MDDSSFCAVCSRQIVPKRTIVPIYAPEPSPQNDSPRTKKQGNLRQRSGLVNGTGRVRPNGTIKAATPVKTRVEIDQSPAPLYCSDECRQSDTEFFHGRPLYSDSASSDTSDDQEDGLRTARHSRHHSYEQSTPNTRSLAILQREYGMQPLPPPTCETYNELAPRVPRAPYQPPAYTSGIMMAHRRIDAILPKALKPGERPPPLKPVPGWTDGSQAWRASTYSFAPPPQTRADVLDPNRAAYQSFHASPHRSAQSGVTASSVSSSGGYGSAPSSPTASVASASVSSSNSELLSSFEDSFARRTSSRLSLASSPSSTCASSSPPRKNRPVAHLAASKLLVPDVLLRPTPPKPASSCYSTSPSPSTSSRAERRHSSGSFNAQRRIRSPLSKEGSVVSGSGSGSDEDRRPCLEAAEEAEYVKTCDVLTMPSMRPTIETRSWSYDNVRTYPVMALPALKETRVVDGVEVEVEVPRPPPKRLFTFAEIPVARREVYAL
ncbi:hypothetical protein DFH08DRAFT_183812 [Mycena albidolilacea]|uniref:Uncharacterized protein n=1 Tax=Mycena albidolilacea TaxID=1033008 RepID=A0AAD7AS80_9AGAR|nr:hypothetical protein DFH08DRAFT_183812 [Mycena albidolilacea]